MATPRALRPPVQISAVCFALSALSFVVGWALAAVAAADIEGFFYQPRVLAVTHTFTLGWISFAIIGVLYQFVPSLTKQPIWWTKAAPYQVGLFAAGSIGIVAHFWMGRLAGMEWSAGVVLISVLLLVALMLPSLARASRFDATLIGVTAALIYFLGAAVLGTLYAIDKLHPFLGGTVLSNIAGHAHLALLGWVTLMICAVSYRMIAAFALPEVLLPRAARYQIIWLICVIPMLLVTLLLRSRATIIVGLFAAGTLGWYGFIIWRLLRTRRMPFDWSMAHVVAALVHLTGAVVCGFALLVAVDPGSELGNRVVITYGVLALIGWISNFIVGMASRMTSGLVGRGAKPLLSNAGRGVLFALLNGGILAVIGAALSGALGALRVAALVPLAAGLWFAQALLGRLMQPLNGKT